MPLVSVVAGIVKLKKGRLMNKINRQIKAEAVEEMKELIEQVWSDSMSDNGAIWERSSAILNQAHIDYPEIYAEAMVWLYSKEQETWESRW
jgi:hypothetical protein